MQAIIEDPMKCTGYLALLACLLGGCDNDDTVSDPDGKYRIAASCSIDQLDKTLRSEADATLVVSFDTDANALEAVRRDSVHLLAGQSQSRHAFGT